MNQIFELTHFWITKIRKPKNFNISGKIFVKSDLYFYVKLLTDKQTDKQTNAG